MQIMADSSLPSQPGPGHPATGARPPGPAAAGGCVLQVQVFGSNFSEGRRERRPRSSYIVERT